MCTSAQVTLRNNSLQPAGGGRLVAALLDEEGNLLESQNLGQLQLDCEELQEQQVRFSQQGRRVVLRYAGPAVAGSSANAASITLDGQPLTLDSFDENGHAELSDLAPGQYLLTVIPEAANALVTVNGETAENGMHNLTVGYENVTYTITITSPDGTNSRSYVIDIRCNYHTVTAEAGPNGSISPEGERKVNHGDDQSYTITPDAGYAIADVLVDGQSVGAVKVYTFRNVESDHRICVIFEKVQEPPTGDNSPILLWSVLTASCGAVLTLLLLRKRKKQQP